MEKINKGIERLPKKENFLMKMLSILIIFLKLY